MNAALLGLVTALSWGVSDFMARFTSRALGATLALAGMMTGGLVAVAVPLILSEEGPIWRPDALPWVLAHGVALAVAMLVFYESLRRGPLSLAIPLVGAYPAWWLIFTTAVRGQWPDPMALGAMLVVMVGVWLVARYGVEERESSGVASERLTTAVLALLGGVLFCVAIALAEPVTTAMGELMTVAVGRLVAVPCLVALIVVRRQPLRIPFRWTVFILGQGLLDALGYAALFAGSGGVDGSTAVVVSSAFGVVTVLLAWTVLRERIAALQWVGIAGVFAGVAILAAQAPA